MPHSLADCRELVLATTNPHKTRELVDLLIPLKIPVRSLVDEPQVQAVVEDGTTLAENARKKASGYARQLGKWVLADDTGLFVDALAGAPGVRSARFAGPNATPAMNLALLLEQLQEVPDDQRQARFVCHLALADPDGNIVLETTGECRGTIGHSLIGEFGFGYDSLFLVGELNQTLAQLDPEQTATVGHRGKAARAMQEAWQRR